MKRLFPIVLACSLIASCGGGNSSPSGASTFIVPPVSAASGFTVANLSGGYAFGVSGGTNSGIAAGSGVASLDGNGNVTAGEETVNLGGILCHATFSGTYTVNTNGTGSASITSVVDAASASRGCVGGTSSLNLAIGAGGNTLILSGQSASAVTLYTAVKQ